jgi:hypothetical protein
MQKPYLYWLFANINDIDVCRQLSYVFGDGGEAELQNFPISLAASIAPQTLVYYGGCTGPVGDQTVAALDAMDAAGQLPRSVIYVRCVNEAAPPRILKSNHAGTQERIDNGEELRFELNAALAQFGLVLWQDPALELV